jgi:hypothetical protein
MNYEQARELREILIVTRDALDKLAAKYDTLVTENARLLSMVNATFILKIMEDNPESTNEWMADRIVEALLSQDMPHEHRWVAEAHQLPGRILFEVKLLNGFDEVFCADCGAQPKERG